MPFLHLTLFSFVLVAQALVPRGATCTQQYTVQAGDSCNTIEKNFKIASGTVRSLNSLVNPQCTNLYPGQSLCLSTSSSGSSGSGGGGGTSCSQTYTVQLGDSCSKIEKNFGLSAGSVIKLNFAINSQCTNMYPGQSLCLVAGDSSSGGGGGGGSTVTVTVTSAGPMQTATTLITLTQTHTLSASTETETKTLSPTTVTATVPISVTATETSLVTTTATVTKTTTQSETVIVTSSATPSTSCPSVSRFACATKDKTGMTLEYEASQLSRPETQCAYFSPGGLGFCTYKKADGTLIRDGDNGTCPARMESVYTFQ
ncbi:hypothetical protein PM082_007618 [Marasmius tenuissimus]|nr:hypothetical protein PM082_007618 [Marasmius tenuissimus]